MKDPEKCPFRIIIYLQNYLFSQQPLKKGNIVFFNTCTARHFTGPLTARPHTQERLYPFVWLMGH